MSSSGSGAHERAFEKLARLGYAARGAVYVIVGGLAILAAVGRGGSAPDSKSALSAVLSQPFGAVLLALVGVGLVGFALWRFAQAGLDADRLGTGAKALGRRLGYGVSGVINLGLAVSAARLALGASTSGGGGDAAARDWTASLLAMPAGQWLVGACGLIIAGVGVGTGVKAWKARFEEHLAIDSGTRRWVRPVGRLGYAARALVFLVAGLLLSLAALHANSREAKGLSGAMRYLQEQPYGWALFGFVALGLFAFGIFQFVLARYRRIDSPDLGRVAGAAGLRT